MRLLKTFGLAALAAVAAMAFAGAGTAAAEPTVVCKVEATPCPPANVLEQGNKAEGTGEKIKAEAVGPQLTVFEDANQVNVDEELRCATSTVEGLYQEKGVQGGEEQHRGEITNLEFNDCDIKGVGFDECHSPGQPDGEIMGEQLPYQTLLTWTAGQDGELVVFEQDENGQPGTTIICTVFNNQVLNCTYKVAETHEQVAGEQNAGVLDVFGATPEEQAQAVASELKLKFDPAVGPECVGEGKAEWEANYHALEPNGGELFVSKQ